MDNDKVLNQSEPDLTPKPHISYAEFSEMRSKYYNLEDQYNKLKQDYELLVEDNERLKPNSENHHMILDIHPYCDKCLKFKPVVKKYIDILEETMFAGPNMIDLPNPDAPTTKHNFIKSDFVYCIARGNTVVSCEHHDICSNMYDYIYKHLRKK